MVETGLYHPFSFVSRKDKIDLQTIWRTGKVDIVITGSFSDVSLKDLTTDATVATATPTTHDINEVTITSFRLTYEMIAGDQLYLSIDDKYFSDCIIEAKTSTLRYDCVMYLFSKNACSNQYYDWDNDTNELEIGVTDASEITPEFEHEETIIITDKGKKTIPVRTSKRYRLEFVAPAQMVNMLEGMKLNDTNYILTQYDNAQIVNLNYSSEEEPNGRYAKFVLSFEYADTITDGNTCCDDVTIDDILSPETPSGDCEGYTAEIVDTDGTLTVTLTNEPAGTPTYKWYRNNVYLSNASSITIVGAGNYRVDVTDAGCRTSAAYYKDNVCALFSLELTKTLNEINGTVSNVPDGETPSYTVVFEGSEVGTSLPHTATDSGIYYVYATAGECQKVKGIYVEVVESDCEFTVDIEVDGSTLTADTDADTPSYKWELETGSGRTEIGTTESITATGKGIYWLTVTQGACEKETYVYIEPTTEGAIFITMAKMTGTEISVTDLDLGSITQPALELEVYVNGVLQTYVSPTPLTSGQYGISSGKLVFSSALSNATIKIIKR